MADPLVGRLTGFAHAGDVNVEVPVVVLVDPSVPLVAEVAGHGPVPADRLLGEAGATVWRRLVARDGIVIGGDSRQCRFIEVLAELIRACDAPIREIGHFHRWADGRGLCTFHNRVRETCGGTHGRRRLCGAHDRPDRAHRPIRARPVHHRPPSPPDRPWCTPRS